MEGAATGVDRFWIEPRWWGIDAVEEIPQWLRSHSEGSGVPLHTGMDESVDVFLAEGGQSVDGCIGHRVMRSSMTRWPTYLVASCGLRARTLS